MTNSMITLKLLVNKRDHKIVFAEVNKDIVDFLFYILTLPIGAITKLFAKEPLSGSLGDLYQSIENLNDMYILQNMSKDTVLNPKMFPVKICFQFQKVPQQTTGNFIGVSVNPANVAVEEVGFVKGVVTYMVMDDLVVKPMSTISTITLLNKLSIKDVSGLEEREVHFGIEEVYTSYIYSFNFPCLYFLGFCQLQSHTRL
ncbi:hypothetical protein Hanom_Chr08g00705241 [Helianthus anomalus]